MFKKRFKILPQIAFVGVLAVLVLGFAIYSFSTSNENEVSLSGQVLGSAPSDASTLDVYIENRSLKVGNIQPSFTLLRFVAYGGSNFRIPGVSGTRVQFYLVLLNQSPNGAAYVGKILYSSSTTSVNPTQGRWTAVGTPTIFSTYVNFNHIVNYSTNNRSRARLPIAPMQLTGTTWVSPNSGSFYRSSVGTVILADGTAASQQGNWTIGFSYNSSSSGTRLGSGSSPFYSSGLTYTLQSFSSAQYNSPVFVGFVSPAGVNLTNLNQLELRLSERVSSLSTFNFTCFDSDGGNNSLVGGYHGLLYGNDSTPHVLLADLCVPGTVAPNGIIIRVASTYEGSCSGAIPRHSLIMCGSAACNAASTACVVVPVTLNYTDYCNNYGSYNLNGNIAYDNSSVTRDARYSNGTYLYINQTLGRQNTVCPSLIYYNSSYIRRGFCRWYPSPTLDSVLDICPSGTICSNFTTGARCV